MLKRKDYQKLFITVGVLTACLLFGPYVTSIGADTGEGVVVANQTLSKTPAQASAKPKFNRVFRIHENVDAAKKLVVRPEYLKKLDDLLQRGVDAGVYPGCQVFASKNGTIIYQKSFGTYSYGKSPAINDSTLYDIASVTKIAATNLMVMKLVEEGKLNLSQTLSYYLPEVTKGTDKGGIIIKDLLLHQAGLKAWVPFYKATLDSLTSRPRKDLYRFKSEPGYSIPVAKNLYLKDTYTDSIWNTILTNPLHGRRYVYSDLDFYFLKLVSERVAGMGLEAYVNQNFYQPLGLKNTLFNPWKIGREVQCAPTEQDTYFRYQHLQGYVHDPGAAMAGGVAGHAGLFSTARDLGVLMQMLLNGGRYESKDYFSTATLRLFTAYNSSISRRGLGFDKPNKEAGDGGPSSDGSSKSTFGHQGFTGTCAWADPESGIVFIFLSNRVNPSADNWKISRQNVRTDAQELIYKALGYGS